MIEKERKKLIGKKKKKGQSANAPKKMLQREKRWYDHKV